MYDKARNSLNQSLERNEELVFLDETIFTSMTELDSAFTPKKINFSRDTKPDHAKRLNLLMAISPRIGVVA